MDVLSPSGGPIRLPVGGRTTIETPAPIIDDALAAGAYRTSSLVGGAPAFTSLSGSTDLSAPDQPGTGANSDRPSRETAWEPAPAKLTVWRSLIGSSALSQILALVERSNGTPSVITTLPYLSQTRMGTLIRQVA